MVVVKEEDFILFAALVGLVLSLIVSGQVHRWKHSELYSSHLKRLLLHVDLQAVLAHVVERVGKEGGHLLLGRLLFLLVHWLLSFCDLNIFPKHNNGDVCLKH